MQDPPQQSGSGNRQRQGKVVNAEQPTKKQPAQKQPAQKQPAQKQTAQKQTAQKQTANKLPEVVKVSCAYGQRDVRSIGLSREVLRACTWDVSVLCTRLDSFNLTNSLSGGLAQVSAGVHIYQL